MASDRIVTAKHVLHASMELERRGSDRVLKELEALEPDLVEVLLDRTSQIYHRLIRLGLSGQQARRIYRRAESVALVCLMAQRRAHVDFWSSAPSEPPGPDDDPPRS